MVAFLCQPQGYWCHFKAIRPTDWTAFCFPLCAFSKQLQRRVQQCQWLIRCREETWVSQPVTLQMCSGLGLHGLLKRVYSSSSFLMLNTQTPLSSLSLSQGCASPQNLAGFGFGWIQTEEIWLMQIGPNPNNSQVRSSKRFGPIWMCQNISDHSTLWEHSIG